MTTYINGRFLTQRVTGVQRYAREVVRALDELVGDEREATRRDIVLLTPRVGLLEPPRLSRMARREVGRLRGHVWEQVELPIASRHGVLVSLGNVGPLAHRRQLLVIYDASVFAHPETYSRTFGAFYRALLPRLGQAAWRIITVSAFSRSELGRYAGIAADKIEVVPAGGDHIRRAPADPGILSRLGLATRPFILTVGSRSRHKNIAGLIRALELMDCRDFDVVIPGGVNSRVFGVPTIDSPAFKDAGYVTDGELRALYEHAACFVYPSLYEGFGLPPLEAMTCGCPVITSRAASLPEVCGDAACYFDPSNPADIARTITTVMGDPGLRASLSERGLARAARFRWRRTAEDFLRLIDQATATP